MKDMDGYRKRGKLASIRNANRPKFIAKTSAYAMWQSGMTFMEIALATGASISRVKTEIARSLAMED